MCSTCGCGAGNVRIEGKHHTHGEKADSPHHHKHNHNHDHGHAHSHEHSHAHRHSHSHAPGTSEARMVQIEQDLLAKNDAFAASNRAFFARHSIFALNLVSSPGAGKTTLLVRTISALKGMLPLGVIEGDQQTANDADRIRASGAPAIQINTGKGCHLDAHMVGHAVENLEPSDGSALFIENVGNLVCPAGFDLGEAHKVVILSVTEGDDKPLKYPDMFAVSSLMLVNKSDLLPYVDFDVEAAIANAQRVNPGIKALTVSAKTGEGMDAWLAWLQAGCAEAAEGAKKAG